ncbi:hypothetical protein N7532_000041 [Penicillium argentinense]|uniref:Uncharacterized protein n=1 Tax=Penicillium argentinense TaxID=1131581 RepID=A0A9W9G4S2_9EURO|nr:uncharacterized protein N7532_000041 [Penicillium argentinense]KAJ5111996.1 hypothetical protein N7532_000041 [Penicillium argentinense]
MQTVVLPKLTPSFQAKVQAFTLNESVFHLERYVDSDHGGTVATICFSEDEILHTELLNTSVAFALRQ